MFFNPARTAARAPDGLARCPTDGAKRLSIMKRRGDQKCVVDERGRPTGLSSAASLAVSDTNSRLVTLICCPVVRLQATHTAAELAERRSRHNPSPRVSSAHHRPKRRVVIVVMVVVMLCVMHVGGT